MHRRVIAGLFLMVWAATAGGCNDSSSNANTQNVSASGHGLEQVLHLTTSGSAGSPEKTNLPPLHSEGEILLQLDIYELTVPFGAISSNDEFWKHIDEDHVDLKTHYLLLNNGLRFGIGPNEEWAYFKGLIDHYGASAKKGCTAPSKKGTLELPLRTKIDSQDVFFIDGQGKLSGRSYDKCDDFLSLTFEPTPRHPGDARIEACALIRSVRKQFQVTVRNEEREIEYVQPEYIYDLCLRQDVPMDYFLVIGPSSLATLPDNLGHSFLVKPGAAEPTETVLLLVPRPYRITGPTANVPLGRAAEAVGETRKSSTTSKSPNQ